jgi:anthranilate phosphoribosyltransferase
MGESGKWGFYSPQHPQNRTIGFYRIQTTNLIANAARLVGVSGVFIVDF